MAKNENLFRITPLSPFLLPLPWWVSRWPSEHPLTWWLACPPLFLQVGLLGAVGLTVDTSAALPCWWQWLLSECRTEFELSTTASWTSRVQAECLPGSPPSSWTCTSAWALPPSLPSSSPLDPQTPSCLGPLRLSEKLLEIKHRIAGLDYARIRIQRCRNSATSKTRRQSNR